MSPDDGFIFADFSYSPLYMLQTSPEFEALRRQLSPQQLKQAVPRVSFWSDIVTASWIHLSEEKKSGEDSKAGDLRFIMQCHIQNDNTQYIMEQVIDPNTETDELRLPWPGKDFRLGTNEGKALLGTALGSGPARMLYDHRQIFPRKTIQLVTIWTVGNQYYMLLTLSRSRASPEVRDLLTAAK